MFNDILGTTLGVNGEGGYSATPMTAFGDAAESQPSTLNPQPLFTGKPHVDGLGHAFLFRNYHAGLGKWLTADPLGYPDGWNQLAYGPNSPYDGYDYMGAAWGNREMVEYYYRYSPTALMAIYGQIVSWIGVYDSIDTDFMELTSAIFGRIMDIGILDRVRAQITNKLVKQIRAGWRGMSSSGIGYYYYRTSKSYSFKSVVWALGDGTVSTESHITYAWNIYEYGGQYWCSLAWSSATDVLYYDVFRDPADVSHYLGIPVELGGVPYEYSHTWHETLSDMITFRLE